MPKIKGDKQKAVKKVVELMWEFKITPQDIVDELAYAIKLNKQFSKEKK